MADILLHAYAEMLSEKTARFFERDEDGEELPKDGHPADCAIICGGTLRGDSQYGPGELHCALLSRFPQLMWQQPQVFKARSPWKNPGDLALRRPCCVH